MLLTNSNTLLPWQAAIGALIGFPIPAAAQQGAYFVLEGGGMPLVIERLDPILGPGQVSNHVHSIVGGNGFASTMDFAQTQRSTCATVSPIVDKSNYWMPNLYFHDLVHPVRQCEPLTSRDPH
jgi:hypothetical protein